MKKIFLSFIIFLFTGCYNYVELNEIDIVTGIAIDKSNDGYQISYVISNSQKPEGSTESENAKVTILSGHGKSISEATLDLNLKNPKTAYLGHVSVIVISEEIAKDSIYPILDAILRKSESIQKFYIIITRNCKANEIVKTISPLESFSSDNISSNIEVTNKEQGLGVAVKLSDFLNNIIKDGTTAYLPTVTLEGKTNGTTNQKDLQETEVKTYASISTMALFKDYQMVHFTTRDESRGINILNNRVKMLDLSNKFYDDIIATEFTDVTSKIELKFKNGEPIFDVNVTASGVVEEYNGSKDLKDLEIIEEIESLYNKDLKNMMKKSLKVMKELEVDPIGFGNLIYIENPKLYQKIKDTYIKDLKVNINVDTNIEAKASLANTIKEAHK